MKCPYCGVEFNLDEFPYGMEEGALYETACPECKKSFVYDVSIQYDYDCRKADCLNGAAHNWQPTATSPKCATKMQCSICGEERNPTEKEKKKYNIPSYKEYFDNLNKNK